MTTASENAQNVIAEAKKFSDAAMPYVYGGKGEMLCKAQAAHVKKLSEMYKDKSTFSHVLGDTKTNNGKNWNWTLSKDSTDQYMIDCSGLTALAYKRGMNKDIGAGSGGQASKAAEEGIPALSPSQAQPGDVLWRSGHVAIMGNNDKVIEAKGWKYGCVEGASAKTAFTYAYRFTGGATTSTGGGNTSTSSLSSTQIQSAITYNKKNNQSICKKIQGLVGVAQDGAFGPITVKAIAVWQSKNGLDPDGKFGPASKAKAKFDENAAPAPTTAQPVAQTSSKITLTKAQQQAAIKYNKNKNQSLCKKIQGLVGVSQDGSFGPITVNAIANWQNKNGLEPDGMFGPASKTKAGFTSASNSDKTDTSTNTTPAQQPAQPAQPSGGTVATQPDDYTGTEEIRIYSKNKMAVTTLQRLLNAHGANVGVDGDFGKKTATAVMRFQYHYVYTDAASAFRTFHNAGKKAPVTAETWTALRQATPAVKNQPGVGYGFDHDTGKRIDEVPTADIVANGKKVGKMTPSAAAKFNDMANASGGLIAGTTSTFRGMTDEATKAVTGGVGGSSGAIELYVDRNFDASLAAVPGRSWHCSGRAVDIAGFSSKTDKPKVWKWLNTYASTYSFTPYAGETWHWNYKG